MRAELLARPAERPLWAVAGDLYDVLITGDQTDGHYALLHARVPPGGGPPPHTHTREDEAFYIVEGEMQFTVGDRRYTCAQGMFLHAPRGIEHCFRNESTRTARMLVWLTPAGFDQFFMQAGVCCAPNTIDAPPPTPADLARLTELAPRYGVHIRVPT